MRVDRHTGEILSRFGRVPTFTPEPPAEVERVAMLHRELIRARVTVAAYAVAGVAILAGFIVLLVTDPGFAILCAAIAAIVTFRHLAKRRR